MDLKNVFFAIKVDERECYDDYKKMSREKAERPTIFMND